MRKWWLLVLWVICGFILPLITNAGTWCITVNDDGSKTVIWSDNVWWDINLTIASWDLEGLYYRWRNDSSNNWDDNPTDEEQHNNDWWWWSDSVENWFNSWLNRKRQWPCPKWWHVPSRWERNSLVLAWCNIDSWCNAWYSDIISWWFAWNFTKSSDWTESNKLINIIWSAELVTKIQNEFFLRNAWSSSPFPDDPWWAFVFSAGDFEIFPDVFGIRNQKERVRCFKNPYELPEILRVAFTNDNDIVWSWEIESWATMPAEVISWYNLTWLTKTWYNFLWWAVSGSNEIFDVENDVVTTWMVLNAVREIINYEIKYELDGWINSENNTWKYTIETPDITLENPTKNWYNFDGWFLDTWFTTQITEITQWSTWNITLYAKWTKIETKPSWGSSGWGGSSASKSDSKQTDKNDTGEKIPPVSPLTEGGLEQPNGQNDASLIKGGAEWNEAEGFSEEFQQAYEFAHEKWITTMPTINDANMNWKLTRIAMAKMLSYYAINVLWMKPDETRINKFNDITEKLDAQYDSGVTLAYQLWIMWINMPDNKFRPNDEVTRAEFATALSRMLYNTSDSEYKSTPKYYIHHMEKLLKEWIITKNDPAMKELRGYVMIMLMRSSKK